MPADAAAPPPWDEATLFPRAPRTGRWGYRSGRRKHIDCDLAQLDQALREDRWLNIGLVWSPDSEFMQPPMALAVLHQACRRRQMKSLLQTMVIVALCGIPLLGVYFWLVSQPGASLQQTREFMLAYIAGNLLTPLGIYAWQHHQASRFTPAYAAAQVQSSRYSAWLNQARPVYSLAMVAALVALYLLQSHLPHTATTQLSLDQSIQDAGLVKPIGGQWWRLFTAPFLHGSGIHVYCNAIFLWLLGFQVERLGGGAPTAALVFLLSALCGSLLSLCFTAATSVGASGGIAGLLGFLIVFGWHHRRRMPPRFVHSMLFVAALNAAFGIGLSGMIDNMAHLGGLLGGIAIGSVLLLQSPDMIPLRPPRPYRWAGRLCQVIGFAVPISIAIMFLRET